MSQFPLARFTASGVEEKCDWRGFVGVKKAPKMPEIAPKYNVWNFFKASFHFSILDVLPAKNVYVFVLHAFQGTINVQYQLFCGKEF